MVNNLTIVELPEFIRKADKLMNTEEHDNDRCRSLCGLLNGAWNYR